MLKRVTVLSCMIAMSISVAGFAQASSGGPGVPATGTKEGQSIGLTGVDNARQLGGYVTKDGRTIKDGLLLRSGKLTDATPEDISRLTEQYHLAQVIDFRTTSEIALGQDPVIDGAVNTQIRILDENNPDSEIDAAMVGIYTQNPVEGMLHMLEGGMKQETMYVNTASDPHSQNGYKQFFDALLANGDGSVLWHCSGGKDRAGVATVLLLSALGVDEETILEDFALTNEFYASRITYMEEEAKKLTNDPKLIEGVKMLTGVNAAYMQNMLTEIDATYGSMDAYLHQAIGLTDEDILRLKAKYLE